MIKLRQKFAVEQAPLTTIKCPKPTSINYQNNYQVPLPEIAEILLGISRYYLCLKKKS